MSEYKSLETQRIDDIGKRMLVLMSQMTEVHPDSPEATDLRAEAEKLEGELNKLQETFFIGKPWWFKPFLYVVGTSMQMLQPLFKVCFRFFHMVKGLM